MLYSSIINILNFKNYRRKAMLRSSSSIIH